MRGRSPLPSGTPLHVWLVRKRLTRREFAGKCSELLGMPVSTNTVHKWASGWARPNRHSRLLLARATGGEVPVTVPWPVAKKSPAKRRRAA